MEPLRRKRKHPKVTVSAPQAPSPRIDQIVGPARVPGSPKAERIYGQLEIFDAGKLVKAIDVNINSIKYAEDGSGIRLVQAWESEMWLSVHGGVVIGYMAENEAKLQEFRKKDVIYE